MILIACFVLVILLCYRELSGSVRRSLPDVEEFPTWFSLVGQEWFSLVDKVKNPSLPPLHESPSSVPPIRWRKGDLIGCGAFGSVYLSMNLDSGELIAVKQVLTAATTASKKKKAQAQIKELEEEVKLLKNLNHPNIVGYLGTVRDEETVNILLEYVPGGSISSLLCKFGAFTEAVIRTYTKQLLLGLEYLHRNGIMHRDIKGANILVDAKGCIKLADFGASKEVAELATMTGAKSTRGTPYWMAPEVILQTGHSFSADIWSVGCTVIEMATGKPPWSQQYQEVAALFYIGTTKSHPPIPEHISAEAKDFLLQCFQEEPNLRPAASELLQHPFLTGDTMESYPVIHSPVMENSETPSPSYGKSLENFKITNCPSLGSLQYSTVSAHYWRADCTDDVMCQIDDDDFTLSSIKAIKLEKLQTPLYEEFFNSLNAAASPSYADSTCDETTLRFLRLLPKSRSLSRGLIGSPSAAIDVHSTGNPGSNGRCASNICGASDQALKDPPSPLLSVWKVLLDDAQQEPNNRSMSVWERQRKWKEELDQELERKREMTLQARVGGNTSSPKEENTDNEDDILLSEVKLYSSLMPGGFKSFNPITEPSDEWECKFGGSPQRESYSINLDTTKQIHLPACCSGTFSDGDKELSVPSGPSLSNTDDELIGSHIRVFLDGKAIKLQTPLYEEFFNSLNAAASPSDVDSTCDETTLRFLKLPPQSRSPCPIASPSAAIDVLSTGDPGSNGRRASNVCGASDQTLKDTPSPPLSVWKVLLDDAQQELNNPSMSFWERQRKWKEELDQELERKREMTCQARVGGNTSSPKEENRDNDMCHIDEDDILLSEVKLYSSLMPGSFKSFNPITEPLDEWECKFGGSPQRESYSINLDTTQQIHLSACCSGTYSDGDKELSFPAGPSLFETDDEVIKSKIRVFLDGKAIELKKLQTPLYEEFFNSLNAAASPSFVDSICDETTLRLLKLPPKSRSPSLGPIASPSAATDVLRTGSPGSNGWRASNVCGESDQTLKDRPSPPLSVCKVLPDDAQQEPNKQSMSFWERQRKWKEELERKREMMMRQAGGGRNTSSPKEDSTDNDVCHIDEDDILLRLSEVKLYSSLMPGSFKSFNPITEPSDEWECKFGGSINLDTTQQIHLPACCSGTYSDGDRELSFPAGSSPSCVESTCDETTPRFLKLPSKSRSPSQGPIASLSAIVDVFSIGSPGSSGRCASNGCSASDQILKDTPSPVLSDWKGLRDGAQQEPNCPRFVPEFQAGVGGKTSSPEDRGLNKQWGNTRFADSMSLDWVRVARHKLLLCCWMDILPMLCVLVIGLWGCLFILYVEKATTRLWLPPRSLFSVALPLEQLASVSSLPFLMYFVLQ